MGPAAVRLLLIPGLTEATVDGLLAMPILGLPILWGMSLGFILKAVGALHGHCTVLTVIIFAHVCYISLACMHACAQCS